MLQIQKQLRSVDVGDGNVERVLATIGAEPLVLFRKTHAIAPPKFTAEQWERLQNEFSALPDSDSVTRGRDELNSWQAHNDAAYNCHTLAIGTRLGIGPEYWLEGSTSAFTLMENPTGTLLDAFFEPVELADITELLRAAKHDDVLLFSHSHTGDLAHSGCIRLVHGAPWVLSKLGEHGVTLSTPMVLAREFWGQYDTVTLHRFRNSHLRRRSNRLRVVGV